VSKTVWIVDDSSLIRKIVETVLTREGYHYRGFEDGIKMMEALREEAPYQPDLLILDVNLPKMNGFEVARRLRMKPAYRYMLIFFMSKTGGLFPHTLGKLVFAVEYIDKPFERERFIELVEKHIGKGEPR